MPLDEHLNKKNETSKTEARPLQLDSPTHELNFSAASSVVLDNNNIFEGYNKELNTENLWYNQMENLREQVALHI